MIEKERMLQMVLENPRLMEDYNYNSEEYPDCYTALNGENAVVAAIAMIIEQISADLAKGKLIEEKQLYLKVFDYLNLNLLYEG